MLRIVAVVGAAGLLAQPDQRDRQPGRGAYLHPAPECLELAERRRALPRALHTEGTLDLSPVRTAVDEHEPKAGRDGEEHAMSAQR